MKLSAIIGASALAMLSACGGGGQSQADNTADQLEKAAEQSDPAAAEILENAADAARENGAQAANIGQEALQEAGNAASATMPAVQVPPPSLQAQPNRTGQQTPPPKVGANTGGNNQ